ncbi:hypothetical protein [Staphylococcus phage vB_StaM_SA1]|nr:hypothetical protein [Staphylococcus phage vB_StaM_SA1]
MNKLLGVLSSLALLVVILAAGVFGYSQFKEINSNSKEDKKVEEVTKKEKEPKKEEKKEKKNEEQTVEESTEVVQEQTTEEVNQNQTQSVEQPQQEEVPSQEAPVQEDDVPVTDNEGNNIDDMDTEEFMSKYTEGMDPEEKETTMDLLRESPGYEDYLRGQVEARQKGEGGVY